MESGREGKNDGGKMKIEIERVLFDVPEGLEFPLELNRHLKDKLHSVLEQNWHLKRHMDYLDKEVVELRKYRSEHRDKCGRETVATVAASSSSTTIMSQRIVELSKKSRDLTAQSETMKTRIQKLVRENDSLRNMVECFRDKDFQEDMANRSCYSNESLEFESKGIATAITTPGSQQYAQLTNKVIEYRRQNQLLRMELKTALRALSQEVGEGATPHGVLNTVTNGNGLSVPSWRGRQQQIITLQQKVFELQLKLKEFMSSSSTGVDLDGQPGNSRSGGSGSGDAADVSLLDNAVPATSSSIIPHRAAAALIQQDKKKHEQIGRLTHDLDLTTKEWKSCQQELKASKARIGTLESSVKTYKSHVEILEGKLNDCEKETDSHFKEMKQLRAEMSAQKERERKYRDQVAIEIQEAQRALQRERAIATRLQTVIKEKQEAMQKLDVEIIELRNKLDISCSGKFAGGTETIDQIRQLEGQLEKAAKAIEAGEKERKSLLKMMQEYLGQTEDERKKVIQTSEHTARLSSALHRANKCINECLEAGQVTSKEILQEVEHIRTLVRELQLGDLYVYESVQNTDVATKLKTQIDMLKREVASLKANLKEISAARRRDLDSFATMTDRVKSDWAEVICLKPRTASYLKKQS